MHIQEAISAYLTYLAKEKRYSPHTITSYANDLSQFESFIHNHYQEVSINKVTATMLRTLLVHWVGEGCNAKTINRKVSSIRSWYKFLVSRDYITKDVTEKLSTPKIPKRLPSFIKESDTRYMSDLPVLNGYSDHRNYAIVQLFYHTGMRRAELIHLYRNDVDFNQARIKVIGKGNKERFIPLGKDIVEILKKYIQIREEEFGQKGNSFLFLTDKGKKMYPKLVYNIVTRELAKVTSSEKKSPHILRHTFASHLLDNGADLNAIKEMLGHANLSATQVYTHNSIAKLKKAYQQAHPKAR